MWWKVAVLSTFALCGVLATGAGAAPRALLQSMQSWTVTGSLNTARAGHTATALTKGQVLVAGGVNAPGGVGRSLTSAELYNPATGRWSVSGRMSSARVDHTATLLRHREGLGG